MTPLSSLSTTYPIVLDDADHWRGIRVSGHYDFFFLIVTGLSGEGGAECVSLLSAALEIEGDKSLSFWQNPIPPPPDLNMSGRSFF